MQWADTISQLQLPHDRSSRSPWSDRSNPRSAMGSTSGQGRPMARPGHRTLHLLHIHGHRSRRCRPQYRRHRGGHHPVRLWTTAVPGVQFISHCGYRSECNGEIEWVLSLVCVHRSSKCFQSFIFQVLLRVIYCTKAGNVSFLLTGT